MDMNDLLIALNGQFKNILNKITTTKKTQIENV